LGHPFPSSDRYRQWEVGDLTRIWLPAARASKAIATVLGRRPEYRSRQEGDRRLDLRGVSLPTVNVIGAQLQRADLHSARLQAAILRSAQLPGSRPRRRQVGGSQLADAQLQKAHLGVAFLQDALLIVHPPKE
jgi:uncharacterized protein YjbI with pentapeptide repeats